MMTTVSPSNFHSSSFTVSLPLPLSPLAQVKAFCREGHHLGEFNAAIKGIESLSRQRHRLQVSPVHPHSRPLILSSHTRHTQS